MNVTQFNPKGYSYMSFPIQTYSHIIFYPYVFCFHSWPYVLNVPLFSSNLINFFSMSVHIFRNLFRNIYPLFWQILITCFRCSRAFFWILLIAKRGAGDELDAKCHQVYYIGALRIYCPQSKFHRS